LRLPLDYSDPADATITLASGVVVSIEVPKFGEDLPLTIDMSSENLVALEEAIVDVIEAVEADFQWSLSTLGVATAESDEN